MSSAAYQAIATNEDDYHTQNSRIARKSQNSRTKPLLLAFAFCVFAIAFFKAGQWSILRQQTLPLVDTTKRPMTADQEADMTPGKYSVG